MRPGNAGDSFAAKGMATLPLLSANAFACVMTSALSDDIDVNMPPAEV
jgi:hypothetical protein